jgi:glycosyltransferase involved in cell wall biosynthesis
VVNVTMQVRNRYRLTRQAITSLARTIAGTDHTLTILDDRSDDETRGYLEPWGKMPRVRVVRNEVPLGTGQLRNMVIEESRQHFGQGEFVAPHDNDTYFTPGWLQALIKAHRFSFDYGFRLLAGYGHPFHLPLSTLPVTKGSYVLFNVREVMAIATQSTFMDWETWDKYGPYCDTPVDRTCQSEDIFLTNKIRADGFKLGVVYPHLIHATALKNTFGEPGPGWELIKAACPEGVICE